MSFIDRPRAVSSVFGQWLECESCSNYCDSLNSDIFHALRVFHTNREPAYDIDDFRGKPDTVPSSGYMHIKKPTRYRELHVDKGRGKTYIEGVFFQKYEMRVITYTVDKLGRTHYNTFGRMRAKSLIEMCDSLQIETP